jgi:hypothetical protein
MTGPAAVLVLTLGQFPVRIPEKYTFQFKVFENNLSRQVEFDVTIDRRIWFWDTFSFKKDKHKALAKNISNNLRQ